MQSITLKNLDVFDKNRKSRLEALDLSFSLGEITLLAGPSGAGKSLLLSCLAGRHDFYSGALAPDEKTLRSKTAYLLQRGLSLSFGKNIKEDLGLSLLASGCSREGLGSALEEILDLCHLRGLEGEKIENLSECEKKRAEIALLLALKRDFYLFDDPFSSLDMKSVRLFLRLLLKLKQEGKGILLASQDLEKVLFHCDRLVLLKDGRLIADGLPERVLPFLEAHGVKKPNQKFHEMTWLQE